MNDNNDTNRELLDEFVNKLIKEKGVPGVAVGILHNGQTLTAGYGVTNIENPLPVTDETLFQIGSITKTYTGTAIMRLVEMGKLDLDATVRTYIPDFQVSDETASSEATIRHLLTHTGGWEGDVFDDTGSGDDALAKYVTNMAELKQLAPLGKVLSYCNSGFSVAGYIIELVTGKNYQAAMKELVLEPLGLSDSYFEPGDVMTHRFAAGHNATPEGVTVLRPWYLASSTYPAGGITCHVQDLLRYARFHMGDGRINDDTRLLSPESMGLMKSPQVTIWGNEKIGITWGIKDINGVRVFSHGGGTLGQISILQLVPEQNFALAILTNAGIGGLVVRETSRWILKHYLELDIPDPVPIESSEEELASYAGHYTRPYADIDLGMLAGKLIGIVTFKGGFPTKNTPPPPPSPPMSIGRCEKDRLLVLDGLAKGDRTEVIRKPDGSIGWLRSGARLYMCEA
ncbi:serine hydrolase domain-containing protein [Chloroflexota bacterium]